MSDDTAWTVDEIAVFYQALAEGLTVQAIAQRLPNRSLSQIQSLKNRCAAPPTRPSTKTGDLSLLSSAIELHEEQSKEDSDSSSTRSLSPSDQQPHAKRPKVAHASHRPVYNRVMRQGTSGRVPVAPPFRYVQQGASQFINPMINPQAWLDPSKRPAKPAKPQSHSSTKHPPSNIASVTIALPARTTPLQTQPNKRKHEVDLPSSDVISDSNSEGSLLDDLPLEPGIQGSKVGISTWNLLFNGLDKAKTVEFQKWCFYEYFYSALDVLYFSHQHFFDCIAILGFTDVCLFFFACKLRRWFNLFELLAV